MHFQPIEVAASCYYTSCKHFKFFQQKLFEWSNTGILFEVRERDYNFFTASNVQFKRRPYEALIVTVEPRMSSSLKMNTVYSLGKSYLFLNQYCMTTIEKFTSTQMLHFIKMLLCSLVTTKIKSVLIVLL